MEKLCNITNYASFYLHVSSKNHFQILKHALFRVYKIFNKNYKLVILTILVLLVLRYSFLCDIQCVSWITKCFNCTCILHYTILITYLQIYYSIKDIYFNIIYIYIYIYIYIFNSLLYLQSVIQFFQFWKLLLSLLLDFSAGRYASIIIESTLTLHFQFYALEFSATQHFFRFL